MYRSAYTEAIRPITVRRATSAGYSACCCPQALPDFFARHHAREDQRCGGPPNRDRVQADDQAQAFHLARDAITVGRMYTAASPSMIASQNSRLSATAAGITARPRPWSA